MIKAQTDPDGVDSPLIKMVSQASQTFMPATFRSDYNKMWGGRGDKSRPLGWKFYSAMKGVERAALTDNVAPSGPRQRSTIRGIFNECLDRISDMKGLETLTMADLQASLWYSEKKIYENVKTPEGIYVKDYNTNDAPDYANEMRRQALAHGVPESTLDTISRRVDQEIAEEAKTKAAAKASKEGSGTGAQTAASKDTTNGKSAGPIKPRFDTLDNKSKGVVFRALIFGDLRRRFGLSLQNGTERQKRLSSVYRSEWKVAETGVRGSNGADGGRASVLDEGRTRRRNGRRLSVQLKPIAVWSPGRGVSDVLSRQIGYLLDS
ncbi:hypothetical protein MUN46_010895 [Mesosutterella sp. AGMB02718]|uniref:Uncharacterized protein n=1 Tax=Mesosutterella faecium TaxID=2925194 RepID=A0ABT7IPY3_9BURK|nr:hypothetical protein [Mesosutterella sp. AGMB02718]MDL2060443.1 hypothetical protein [Mesosutterella sp. AGMB02718]